MTAEPLGKAARKLTNGQRRTSRVLIVDDHPILRRGLAELIGREPDLVVCGEADGSAEALAQVRSQRPDIITLDLVLPDGDGLELIKQIRAIDENARILVCSMHDEMLFAERALHAGALGYISKDQASEAVTTALRRVLSGRIYLSDEIADRLLRRMRGGQEERAERPIDSLTDRELEVFGLFGRGLGAPEIAHRLHISPKTVDAHRQKIKRKLGLGTSPEMVQHAVTWVLEHECSPRGDAN